MKNIYFCFFLKHVFINTCNSEGCEHNIKGRDIVLNRLRMRCHVITNGENDNSVYGFDYMLSVILEGRDFNLTCNSNTEQDFFDNITKWIHSNSNKQQSIVTFKTPGGHYFVIPPITKDLQDKSQTHISVIQKKNQEEDNDDSVLELVKKLSYDRLILDSTSCQMNDFSCPDMCLAINYLIIIHGVSIDDLQNKLAINRDVRSYIERDKGNDCFFSLLMQFIANDLESMGSNERMKGQIESCFNKFFNNILNVARGTRISCVVRILFYIKLISSQDEINSQDERINEEITLDHILTIVKENRLSRELSIKKALRETLSFEKLKAFVEQEEAQARAKDIAQYKEVIAVFQEKGFNIELDLESINNS